MNVVDNVKHQSVYYISGSEHKLVLLFVPCRGTRLGTQDYTVVVLGVHRQ